MKHIEIKQMTNDFREFFAAAKCDDLFFRDGFLEDFPIGCCGFASNLLGRYLVEELHVRCWYSTSKFETYTHAWLAIDGATIIDLTGDQFVLNSNFPVSNT